MNIDLEHLLHGIRMLVVKPQPAKYEASLHNVVLIHALAQNVMGERDSELQIQQLSWNCACI